VTFAPDLPVSGEFHLYVTSDGQGLGAFVKVKESGRLLFNALEWNEYGQLVPSVGQDGEMIMQFVGDYSAPPIGGTLMELYYGTTDNYVKLTGGTFTSSNENVVKAFSPTAEEPYYSLTAMGFGTATITYTNGNVTYTAKVTIELPVNPAIYSEHTRSEGTYLTGADYDPDEDLVLWLMGEEGMTEAEARAVTVSLGDETHTEIVVEPVARKGGGYDVKITLPAGMDISGELSLMPQVPHWWGVPIMIRANEERGIEYRINSITLKDESYRVMTEIPADGFYAEVSVTNLSSTSTDTLVLAAYDENGKMVGTWFLYANPQIDQTFVLGVYIENDDGEIATLKAFMLPMLGSLQPLANTVKIGK